MQIQEESLTSNQLTGCAPIDAALDGFMQLFGGLATDLSLGLKQTFADILGWVESTLPWLDWAKDKIIQSASGISGTIAYIGGKLGPCARVIGGTLLGVVVGGGAILGLTSLIGAGAAWLGSAAATAVGVAGMTLTAGVALASLVKTSRFIYNFNWNISDEAIDRQQQGLINNFYSVMGGALGESLATLTCGAASMKFVASLKLAPVKLVKIQKLLEFSGGENGFEQSGELIQDAVEALFPILQIGVRSALRGLFLETYQNIRRLIKAAIKFPPLATLLPDDWEKAVSAWGTGESWTFKKSIEDRIEKLPQGLQQFAEEFYEEYVEQCANMAMQIAAMA